MIINNIMNRKEEILHQKIAVEWHNRHRNNPELFQRLICYWNNSESKSGGNKMRSMGVKSGISDWIFLKRDGAVMWLELKVDAPQSSDQVKFQALCELIGHEYHIIRTFEDFFAIIEKYL